jgi:AraC-like DNA-binding protein
MYDSLVMKNASLQLKHTHPYCELHLVLNNDSQFTIDGVNVRTKKGQLCWINQGRTKYVFNDPLNEIAHFVTHFEFVIREKNYAEINMNEGAELSFFLSEATHKTFWICADDHGCTEIFNKAHAALNDKHFGYLLKIRTLLTSFIISAIQSIGQQYMFHFTEKYSELDNVAYIVLGYIRSHYMEGVTLNDAARELNISSRHIARVLQQRLGTTFSKALISFQVENAKLYLCQTDYSVCRIAELVGMSSGRMMHNNFKSITGMTAGKYRALNKMHIASSFFEENTENAAKRD